MENLMTIKELIRMVQSDLIEAQKERISAGESPLFETSELELELNTVLTKNDNGNVILAVPIFKAQLSSDYSNQYTQKIKLKFSVAKQEEPDFLPDNTIRMDGRFPELNEMDDE